MVMTLTYGWTLDTLVHCFDAGSEESLRALRRRHVPAVCCFTANAVVFRNDAISTVSSCLEKTRLQNAACVSELQFQITLFVAVICAAIGQERTEIAGVDIEGGQEKQAVDISGVDNEAACRMGGHCRSGQIQSNMLLISNTVYLHTQLRLINFSSRISHVHHLIMCIIMFSCFGADIFKFPAPT